MPATRPESGQTAPVEAIGTGAPDTGAGRAAPAGAGAGGHHAAVLRVACHLVVEVPLVVLGAVELARGWRPLYDNAALALRSYQVFTAHSPLLGHEMAVSAGTHAVYGAGPVQDWLLAVPVRIDPAQGVLWGALVCAVAAVALTVEASWSVAGWRGAATAAGVVLVLGLARTDVDLDVAWNVWCALLFLMAAVAAGVATATGRLRWWPVAVVAATVATQCQTAYAPPALAVCLVAPVVGVAARHRDRSTIGPAWLLVGLGVGAALWAAPLAQQVAGHPGNLTLLTRAARDSGPAIGWSAALHAFGGATGIPPSWVHPPPPSGAALFVAVVHTFSGPAWWGTVVLAALIVVTVGAWRAGRGTLSAMAALTLALSLGALASIATVPASQFLVVGYLGALWVPVGTAVWVTLAWAAGDLVVSWRAGSRAGAAGAGAAPVPWERWEGPVAVGVAVVLVLLSAGVVWRGLDRMDGTAPTLVGWPAVRAAEAAADAAGTVAPTGPFRLEVVGRDGPSDLAVATGTAYLLVTRGLDPRVGSPAAYATFGRPPVGGPTVVVEVRAGGGRVTARRLGG